VKLPEQRNSFRCPRCEARSTGSSLAGRHKRYQCRSCRHQATLNAGTHILEATKVTSGPPGSLPSYLVRPSPNRISSLSSGGSISGNYRTAWLLQRTDHAGMKERDGAYVLREGCQWMMLPWRRTAVWQAWSWIGDKVPVVAAVSVDEAATPGIIKTCTRPVLLFAAIADWAQRFTGDWL